MPLRIPREVIEEIVRDMTPRTRMSDKIAPPCPFCTSSQVLRVERPPAHWRCCACEYAFDFEPMETVA